MPATARAETVGSLLCPAYLLEARDGLQGRIRAASEFVPLERLALTA